MARLWYRPTPADFVVGLGAQAEILDEAGAPLSPQRFGRAALIPLTSDTFDVYTDADGGSVTTDLLDEAGTPITQWTSSTEFETLGRGPAFQGPDGHEGDVFLSADGLTFYKVIPETGLLFQRIAALQTFRDLFDTTTPPADGESWLFDTVTGLYAPGPVGGGSSVLSVNGETGNVTLDSADVGAIPATEKAAASGVASLDSEGHIPQSQLAIDPETVGAVPASVGIQYRRYDSVGGTWQEAGDVSTGTIIIWIKDDPAWPNPPFGGSHMRSQDIVLLAQELTP